MIGELLDSGRSESEVEELSLPAARAIVRARREREGRDQRAMAEMVKALLGAR